MKAELLHRRDRRLTGQDASGSQAQGYLVAGISRRSASGRMRPGQGYRPLGCPQDDTLMHPVLRDVLRQRIKLSVAHHRKQIGGWVNLDLVAPMVMHMIFFP